MDIVCEPVAMKTLLDIVPSSPPPSDEVGTIMVDYTCHSLASSFANSNFSLKLRSGVDIDNITDITPFFRKEEQTKIDTYKDIVDDCNTNGFYTTLLVATTTLHGRPSPSFESAILALAKKAASKRTHRLTAAAIYVDTRSVAELQAKALNHIISDFHLSLLKSSMDALFAVAVAHSHDHSPRDSLSHDGLADPSIPPLDAALV